MKIISWNMGAGFGFRVDRHDRAWRFLQSMSFDFALLQETVVPPWVAEAWSSDCIAYVPRRTGSLWGTAVLSGGPSIQTFEPSSGRHPWLTELQGASLIAHTSEEKIWLVSLHSNAQPVPSELLLRHQHDHVLRCRHDGVWEIELIAGELQEILAGKSFFAGGDLNQSLLFDKVYGRSRNNWKAFANLAAQGFVDTRQTPDEQQTFFRPRSRGYQLDHVFADSEAAATVRSWSVMSTAATDLDLSDHAPIVIDC